MRSKTYVLHETVHSSMIFVVIGKVEKYIRNKHVRKCWQFCQEHNLKAYLVLMDLTEGQKPGNLKLPVRVYPHLAALPEKVDVVVPCLMPRHIPDIVEESVQAGAHTIWFQEKNWTEGFQEQAEEKGLAVVRGCMLKHQSYKGIGKFLRPCFWHGWGCKKILPKYR